MKSVLITGCSSGFGLETAKYFLDRGWKVIATMRKPRADILPTSEHLQLIALDVTDPQSIQQAIEAAGPIDALVNNAGFGWLNAVEGTPMDVVREIFETNTLGTIAMTAAVLPQMRAQQSGVIVNVTSSVTWAPLPLLSVYTATKAAVNAFTESMALELKQFNIRSHLVLPGRAPDTPFGQTAQTRIAAHGGFPPAYNDLVQSLLAQWAQQSPDAITRPIDVAEAVWGAVNDPTSAMRIPAGADSVALATKG